MAEHVVHSKFDPAPARMGASTSIVCHHISRLLQSSWFLSLHGVRAAPKDGKIRLSGRVHSVHARQVAAAIAWGAPGATSIENHITVA